MPLLQSHRTQPRKARGKLTETIARPLSRIPNNSAKRPLASQNRYGLNLATNAIRIWTGTPSLLAALDLGVNSDIKSRVTYSVITKRLNPDDLREFLLREIDRAGLGHNTLTDPAIDLIVRSADGVLRKARNLCVGCLIEAVRSGNKTIDIDNVNRVLRQPHWQKESDLTDF